MANQPNPRALRIRSKEKRKKVVAWSKEHRDGDKGGGMAELRGIAFEGKTRRRASYIFDVQKVITGWFPVIISRAH